MKLAYYIFGLFIILSSCKKNDEPSYSYQNSPDQVNYVIKLSNDTIINYSMYYNGQLTYTLYFYFLDSIVQTIAKNSSNNTTYKDSYKIGNNGFAESDIDSAFSDSGVFVSSSYATYEYDNNGYLTEITDSQYIYTRTIDNGNISSDHVSVGCTDYYTYNSLTSRVDVWNFSNGITGKSNRNLVEHASFDNGCPCGPSSSLPEADYQYELNGNNYVTKQTTIYTPCYSFGTANVTRIVSVTTYQYN